MTEKNREYIFRVKNLLVLNTSRKELNEILTDLEENVLDNSKDYEESFLGERCDSPMNFVKELKAGKMKAAVIKSLVLIMLIIAVYVGFLLCIASVGQLIIMPQLQLPALLMLAVFAGLYLGLSADTLPICRRVAKPSVKSRKAFISMLSISSVLCLPELYLQTIGVRQLLEYGKRIDYKWDHTVIPDILMTCATALIIIHCLVAVIALMRYLTKAETYMSGVVIQSMIALFATVWTNYCWFGTLTSSGPAPTYLFTNNWLLSFVASVIISVMFYRNASKA